MKLFYLHHWYTLVFLIVNVGYLRCPVWFSELLIVFVPNGTISKLLSCIAIRILFLFPTFVDCIVFFLQKFRHGYSRVIHSRFANRLHRIVQKNRLNMNTRTWSFAFLCTNLNFFTARRECRFSQETDFRYIWGFFCLCVFFLLCVFESYVSHAERFSAQVHLSLVFFISTCFLYSTHIWTYWRIISALNLSTLDEEAKRRCYWITERRGRAILAHEEFCIWTHINREEYKEANRKWLLFLLSL